MPLLGSTCPDSRRTGDLRSGERLSGTDSAGGSGRRAALFGGACFAGTRITVGLAFCVSRGWVSIFFGTAVISRVYGSRIYGFRASALLALSGYRGADCGDFALASSSMANMLVVRPVERTSWSRVARSNKSGRLVELDLKLLASTAAGIFSGGGRCLRVVPFEDP